MNITMDRGKGWGAGYGVLSGINQQHNLHNALQEAYKRVAMNLSPSPFRDCDAFQLGQKYHSPWKGPKRFKTEALS